MSEPTEYKILAQYTTWDLEQEVARFLSMGWRLHGSAVCRGDGQYLQVMVR